VLVTLCGDSLVDVRGQTCLRAQTGLTQCSILISIVSCPLLHPCKSRVRSKTNSLAFSGSNMAKSNFVSSPQTIFQKITFQMAESPSSSSSSVEEVPHPNNTSQKKERRAGTTIVVIYDTTKIHRYRRGGRKRLSNILFTIPSHRDRKRRRVEKSGQDITNTSAAANIANVKTVYNKPPQQSRRLVWRRFQ
jgi:hypothetical protein